jgi:hypothetical protein
MSKDREHIGAITAERLIQGARGGSPVGSDRLADLLAALASRPGRRELAGEDAAMTAFRAARLASTPESRRNSMLKTALAKIATAKAAIVLAAVGGGGVALAAGSGHLPGVDTPEHHPGDRPNASVTQSAHATGGNSAPSVAAHGSAAAARRAAEGRSATPNGSPSPNLRGLCTAFDAGVGDNPGKALENPAFTVLITTAGGKDQVGTYCSALLAARSEATPTHPDGDAHPKPSTHGAQPAGPEKTDSHPEPTPTNTHDH